MTWAEREAHKNYIHPINKDMNGKQTDNPKTQPNSLLGKFNDFNLQDSREHQLG